MTEQERNLLRGCLKGEKPAWDAFVRQYSRLAYYAIKRTLSLYHVEPRAEVVEDLFQDFFLSLMRDDFKKLRQFRAKGSAKLVTWLRLIACRQTIDFLRRQKVPTTDAIEIQAPNDADPSISVINQEQNKLLARALETLRPRDRLFVELYFYQNLPPEVTAKILRVSPSAVYTQKSRVLKKLRQALARFGVP